MGTPPRRQGWGERKQPDRWSDCPLLLFNQDSNLDKQDQNLLCCHYTIEQTYPRMRLQR